MSWVITGSQKVNWDPSLISTALWLDAADASTITESGGAISQWNDKSGNSRNVAQDTALRRPTYTFAGLNGLNIITFNGSNNQLFSASAALQRNLSQSAIFGLVQPGSNTAAEKLIVQTLTTSFSRTVISYSASAGFRAGGRRLAANSFQATTDLAYSASANNFGVLFDYAAATLTTFVHGAQSQTRSFQTAGNTEDNAGALYIGLNDNNALPWNGIVCELLFLDSVPTTLIRQKIEGYLAHKWGLTADLPSDHPYKVNVPTP
jgi:hypothetical protein